MASYVRITARPTVDNPNEFPLYADVILDDSSRVSGSHPVFGFQGEIGQRSGASMPFLLQPDGRMDFGEKYASADDRFYHLDLRDISVGIGQLVTIRGDGYESMFRISKVEPLV